MPAMQNRRSRKAVTARRSCTSLECLESRLMLAGNVTARLLGSTLLLTGDVLDNSLVAATAAGGKMAVLGAPGTTINGSTRPFVTNRGVTNIVANMNAGNDAIGFTNSAAGLVRQLAISGISPPPFSEFELQTAIDSVAGVATTFSLPGGLTVTTGAGDDAIGILGNVGGSIVADVGSASSIQGNAIAIGDPLESTVSSRIGGSFSAAGGADNDRVFFTGTDVGGGVAVALGNGANATFLRGTDSSAAAKVGSFAYTGGVGPEEIVLGGKLTVRGDVSIWTGPRGADRIGVFGGVNVGGSVLVNTGAGGGHDSVTMMPASIKRSLSVTTGSGSDEITVQWSEIGGGVAIHCGASNDAVTLGNTTAITAFLYGGSGTNSLSIDAATRTGIRTLKYLQFQRVTRSPVHPPGFRG